VKIFLLAHDDRYADVISQRLLDHGHIVVGGLSHPDELRHEVARTTPHLLVIQTKEATASREVQEKVKPWFPDLATCSLCDEILKTEADWVGQLDAALNQQIKPEIPRVYADGPRYVCHDASFRAASSGKLNRPSRAEGWQKVCAQQEARFLMQLQAGRKNHAAAKNYFACLERQQAGLNQEIGYRLVHGSYKALSWSRDLAVKWLALLAHYVPDCEREYLPLAGTPGPRIDFVHHDLRPEGLYAAALVITAGVKPSILEELAGLVTTRFEPRDQEKLFGVSLWLYGFAKLLESVGRAQIELMDYWLDPTAATQLEEEAVPRGLHRNAGIYRDFYELGFVINFPQPLEAILKGFHAGTTRVEHGRRAAPFADYWRLYHEKEKATTPDP
jgi:hypothetical protein